MHGGSGIFLYLPFCRALQPTSRDYDYKSILQHHLIFLWKMQKPVHTRTSNINAFHMKIDSSCSNVCCMLYCSNDGIFGEHGKDNARKFQNTTCMSIKFVVYFKSSFHLSCFSKAGGNILQTLKHTCFPMINPNNS